jgi:predicted RNA-binding protein with PUA-like domain
MPRYWLMKSEPEAFSWDDLKKSPRKTTMWDGVRNYQARNLLRDQIKKGDMVLFYHSRANPPAVMGTAKVVREGYADPTQFDPKSKYHDSKSHPADPRWFVVDIRMERALDRPVPLPELRETRGLEKMVLLKKGSRLSVQPVSAREWKIILKLGGL